jgi:hypothetical protein
MAILGLTAGAARAADELDDLLRRVPPSVNAVAVVNMKAMRASGATTGLSNLPGVDLPPVIDIMVLGTHLDHENLSERRTGGIVKLNRKVSLKEIATMRNGEVVNVGNMVLIDFGRRGYSVAFAPDILGFARGLSQQELYRWKRFAETNLKVELNGSLLDALAFGKDAPVFGAIDLEFLINARRVRERLADSKLAGSISKGDLSLLADFIGGIKSIAIAIRGEQVNQAEIRLVFDEDVRDRGPIIKAVFLEALDDLGASIEEFEKAKVSTEGKTATLTTQLTPSGLREILSVVAPPPPPPPAPANETPRIEANGASAEATRKYFAHASAMLADLKHYSERAQDARKSSTWHESYAKKIDALDTRYVDPDVAKWGKSLPAKLRTLAYSLRGMVVEVEALETGMAQMVYAAGASGGWFGGSSASIQGNTNAIQLRTQQAEIVRQDAARRNKIWEGIDNDREATAKLITERYGQAPQR